MMKRKRIARNWVEKNSGKTTSNRNGKRKVKSTKQRHRWNVFRSVGRIDDHHNLSKVWLTQCSSRSGNRTKVSEKVVGLVAEAYQHLKIETYPMAMTRTNPLANHRAGLHM